MHTCRDAVRSPQAHLATWAIEIASTGPISSSHSQPSPRTLRRLAKLPKSSTTRGGRVRCVSVRCVEVARLALVPERHGRHSNWSARQGQAVPTFAAPNPTNLLPDFYNEIGRNPH